MYWHLLIEIHLIVHNLVEFRLNSILSYGNLSENSVDRTQPDRLKYFSLVSKNTILLPLHCYMLDEFQTTYKVQYNLENIHEI